MGKKAALILAIVIVALAVLPAMAFGSLTNDYGMNFAGQAKCRAATGTGDAAKFTALHSGFATQGITPAFPTPGPSSAPPAIRRRSPGTKGALWDGGGTYSIAELSWITLGNYGANSATEYLFWQGQRPTRPSCPGTSSRVMVAEPGGEWMIARGLAKGLYDVLYGCQRCHQLGAPRRSPRPRPPTRCPTRRRRSSPPPRRKPAGRATPPRRRPTS